MPAQLLRIIVTSWCSFGLKKLRFHTKCLSGDSLSNSLGTSTLHLIKTAYSGDQVKCSALSLANPKCINFRISTSIQKVLFSFSVSVLVSGPSSSGRLLEYKNNRAPQLTFTNMRSAYIRYTIDPYCSSFRCVARNKPSRQDKKNKHTQLSEFELFGHGACNGENRQ